MMKSIDPFEGIDYHHAYRTASANSAHNAETAFGDFIDNSIDAKATKIKIELYKTKEYKKRTIAKIIITDNGTGMDFNALKRSNAPMHKPSHLPGDKGKYGVGATTAAMHLATKKTTFTRKDGKVLKSILDLTERLPDNPSPLAIEEDDFSQNDLSSTPIKHGTKIILENVAIQNGGSGFFKNLTKYIEEYFRYELSKIESIDLIIYGKDDQIENKKTLKPFDPFFTGEEYSDVHYSHSKKEHKYSIDLSNGEKTEIILNCYDIDTENSHVIESGCHYTEYQAVYFVRNGRQICRENSKQKTCGLYKHNNANKGIRYEIKFDSILEDDGIIKTDNTKTQISNLREDIKEKIKSDINNFRKIANNSYKKRLESKSDESLKTTTNKINKRLIDCKSSSGITTRPGKFRNSNPDNSSPGSIQPKNTGNIRNDKQKDEVPIDVALVDKLKNDLPWDIDFPEDQETNYVIKISKEHEFYEDVWIGMEENEKEMFLLLQYANIETFIAYEGNKEIKIIKDFMEKSSRKFVKFMIYGTK